MRMLFITQKVDSNDTVLGFVHGWLNELACAFSEIQVICLERGRSDLPKNVHLHSLGKEKFRSRVSYLAYFFRYISDIGSYDVVFVHMNEVYVILGALLWKATGKKIYLWRNHPSGTWFTPLAVWLSDKVFCTSRTSYTSKYKKTVLMPAGIDTARFNLDFSTVRKANSFLFLSRLSKIKKPDLLMQSLIRLNRTAWPSGLTVDFFGDADIRDGNYVEALKTSAIDEGLERVYFRSGVPYVDVPHVMSNHDFFVNCTPSGSLDKAILEAMACGCLPIVSNDSFKGVLPIEMMFKEDDSVDLAAKIIHGCAMDDRSKGQVRRMNREYVVREHSLTALIDRLVIEIN